MLQRFDNFSKQGSRLDRIHDSILLVRSQNGKSEQEFNKIQKQSNQLTINYITINEKGQQKKQQIQTIDSSSTSKNNNFNNSLDRNKLSSFQKCHLKQQNINIIYNNVKSEVVKPKNIAYSLKKSQQKSYFDTQREFYQRDEADPSKISCPKFTNKKNYKTLLQRNQMIQTVRDLRKTTISSHNLDFQKQLERPFDRQLKKLARTQSQKSKNLQSTYSQMLHTLPSNSKKLQNLSKIHSFQSSVPRNFLNPETLPSSSSGLNLHQINYLKFKQTHREAHLKFNKFVKKIKTKYDRHEQLWLTKLDYDPKYALVHKNLGQKCLRQFNKQTNRKVNEVHSKYPMRLAM